MDGVRDFCPVFASFVRAGHEPLASQYCPLKAKHYDTPKSFRLFSFRELKTGNGVVEWKFITYFFIFHINKGKMEKNLYISGGVVRGIQKGGWRDIKWNRSISFF
jgi:hypothetical protein